MMVSFLAGICDLCGKASPMATPEQVKSVAMDLLGPDAAICVECVERAKLMVQANPPPDQTEPS